MPFGWQPTTPAEFVGGVALFWVGSSFALATIGGWRRLAEVYRLGDKFRGDQFRLRSARMRWGAGYSNCLMLGANEHGFYMAIFFPFRLFHPPLFIPWSDIGVARKNGWLYKYLDFAFLKAPGVCLRLPENLGRALLKVGGQEQNALREIVA